jgi:hypothetical protein
MQQENLMSNHDDSKSKEIVELRMELANLRTMIGNVAQATAIENVISSGFQELTAQLQPLQDLAPKRKPLSPESNALLRKVLDALARPIWQGSKFDDITKDDKDLHNRLNRLNRSLAP